VLHILFSCSRQYVADGRRHRKHSCSSRCPSLLSLDNAAAPSSIPAPTRHHHALLVWSVHYQSATRSALCTCEAGGLSMLQTCSTAGCRCLHRQQLQWERCSRGLCAVDHQSKRRQMLTGRRRRRWPDNRPVLDAILYSQAQQDAATRRQPVGPGCSCQRHCGNVQQCVKMDHSVHMFENGWVYWQFGMLSLCIEMARIVLDVRPSIWHLSPAPGSCCKCPAAGQQPAPSSPFALL
jgi:hypothetical protein